MTRGHARAPARHGIALLFSLAVAIVCGALIALTLSAVVPHRAAASSFERTYRARAAAEQALWDGVASLSPSDTLLPIGATRRLSGAAAGFEWSLTVARLAGNLYWIVARTATPVAVVPRSAGRVAVLVRLVRDPDGVRFELIPERGWASVP